MARTSKRKRSSFLATFDLDERLLRREEKRSGRPSLVEGYSDNDAQVLVKTWSASKQNESVLQEIWRHEIRQLHRVCGYPGAAEIIAPVHSTGFDDEGFHLALEVGQRRPLATVLEHGARNHWIRQASIISNRIRLWMNLKRICDGIEILHRQGLIHRNLDTWSVLTSGEESLDFQLTGFEWSVRLTSIGASKPSAKGSKQSIATSSFYIDWRDFAFLVSDLLKLDRKKILDPSVSPSSVSERLLTEEVQLLKRLAGADRFDRLDGETINREIDEIVQALERSEAKVAQRLKMAVRLGAQSGLSMAIRSVTDGDIGLQDIGSQIEFIKADVGDRPRLVLIKSEGPSSNRLLLCGHNLTYTLAPFVHRSSQNNNGTWEIAYCEKCESKNPAPVNIISEGLVPSGSIEILGLRDAQKEFPRLRGKLRSWQSHIDSLSKQPSDQGLKVGVQEALALISYVDAIFAAADSFPVAIEQEGDRATDDLFSIRVRVSVDPDREALSEALGLKSPSVRLDDLVQRDSRSEEWVISDGQLVGVKEHSNTNWRLTNRIEDETGVSYRLSGAEPLPPLTQPLLVLSDFVGRDAQFRRRAKSVNALREHAELRQLLADPRLRVLDTHENVSKDCAWNQLDPSKQEAFERIVSTLPLYLVQGPPGVGKTRLVRDLAAHIFDNDPASRVLLSAQANSAIDHLMDEVLAEVELPPDCLVIRPRSKDNEAASDKHSPRAVAKTMISDFCDSSIARDAPKNVEQKINVVREAVCDDPSSGKRAKTGFGSEIQAVEHLVLRSANLVFSTANASSIERLVDEQNQFDWSIVEEAGKANGLELIGPLLLSHRRLLIGDHKQLAPFDKHRLERLFESPKDVLKALSVGASFVGRNLRDDTIDEVLELAEEEDDIAPLCSESIKLLSLFETLIEDQIRWQNDHPHSRPLASVLRHQHRMHPTISRVVSKTFYSGDLETHGSAEKRFLEGPPPLHSADPNRLPDLPLTIVDMPYVQSKLGKRFGDQAPNWQNAEEVTAVTEVLGLLRSSRDASRKPTLAVLSPYNEQVRRLKSHIDEDLSAFTNIEDFVGAVDNSICGTVDSFQGNQADVVIVSLVRNNHRSTLNGALGFLCDARRMNVLFSRARWKLIVVASMEFLTTVLRANEGRDLVEESFLRDLLKNIESEIKAGNAAQVSFEDLIGETS